MTDCIIAFIAGTFVGGIVGFMALCIVSAGGDDADLRREIALNEPLFETLNAANDALLADNAKLRKLVRDMYTTISWCSIDCYPSDGKKRELADRMRELGVEVDA